VRFNSDGGSFLELLLVLDGNKLGIFFVIVVVDMGTTISTTRFSRTILVS
jgi:hypothetical protein